MKSRVLPHIHGADCHSCHAVFHPASYQHSVVHRPERASNCSDTNASNCSGCEGLPPAERRVAIVALMTASFGYTAIEHDGMLVIIQRCPCISWLAKHWTFVNGFGQSLKSLFFCTLSPSSTVHPPLHFHPWTHSHSRSYNTAEKTPTASTRHSTSQQSWSVLLICLFRPWCQTIEILFNTQFHCKYELRNV